MNMPGFTADASVCERTPSYQVESVGLSPTAAVSPQLGFGGFGPTLPTCHWEKQWVVCGSPLPGYPAPMCLDWVYVCKFPGSSRNTLM
jgi:hypothetical protein